MAATGLGLLVALFARQIISVFTNDPIVTQYALGYMWTVALSYGFLAVMMVEANAFQAIDSSWPGFWIFILRFVVITLPISYVLTIIYNFPIISIWLSLTGGNIVAAIIGYIWLRKRMNQITVVKGSTS